MLSNNELKMHFLDVGHGDSTIIEMPDDASGKAHFGVVDFGAKLAVDRETPRDYMLELIELRRDGDPNFDYVIDFVCVTHPHDDHYGGLNRFLAQFADADDAAANRILNFWDCGFRTAAVNYNNALASIRDNDFITFTRVAAGSEYEFGDVRITVLAPSIDLRNRFDTYGVDRNNSSIVLKVKYGNSYAILAADAEFASWGKATEEFPRMQAINYYDDALGLSERRETSDQLKCNVLRCSHHGSKHGNSLEYMERMDPGHVVVSAGDDQWYQNNKPDWLGYFPHPLTTQTIGVLNHQITTHVTGDGGTRIFKYSGDWTPREIQAVAVGPDNGDFAAALAGAWS